MIHVIATIEVKPGMRDAFIAEFHKLVPKVQAEAGCLGYGPAVDAVTDIGRQMPMRDNVVTILERWESLDALKAHFTMPHMADYKQATKDMVLGLELQILEPA